MTHQTQRISDTRLSITNPASPIPTITKSASGRSENCREGDHGKTKGRLRRGVEDQHACQKHQEPYFKCGLEGIT